MKGYLDTDTQYSHHVTIQYNLCQERLVSYLRPAIIIVKLRSSSSSLKPNSQEEERIPTCRDSDFNYSFNAEFDGKTQLDSGLVEKIKMGALRVSSGAHL